MNTQHSLVDSGCVASQHCIVVFSCSDSQLYLLSIAIDKTLYKVSLAVVILSTGVVVGCPELVT